jgi:hypothetical protein
MAHRSDRPAKLAFYEASPFHASILQPIHEACWGQYECCYSCDLEELAAFRPRVLFVSDRPAKAYRKLFPGAIIVWTRHGITSKNWFARCVKQADFAMMCSREDIARQRRLGRGPQIDYWACGYPPLDALSRATCNPKPTTGSPTLLYVPTIDTELSAQTVLGGAGLGAILDDHPQARLWIKPHPHTQKVQPHWMKEWQALQECNASRVRIIPPSQDAISCYPQADVLISDVSSAAFFFLLLDRPIVFVDNPMRSQSPKFDPNGIEWTHRHCGLAVGDIDGAVAAVGRALEYPESMRDSRQEVRQLLFEDQFDGQVIQRVMQCLDTIKDDASFRRHYGLGAAAKKRIRNLANWLYWHRPGLGPKHAKGH